MLYPIGDSILSRIKMLYYIEASIISHVIVLYSGSDNILTRISMLYSIEASITSHVTMLSQKEEASCRASECFLDLRLIRRKMDS